MEFESPTRCREPSGLLPTNWWSPGTGLTVRPSWSRRRQARDRGSCRPCHPRATISGHQRYVADSHGHFKAADGWVHSSDLDCLSRPKLHGMQEVKG